MVLFLDPQIFIHNLIKMIADFMQEGSDKGNTKLFSLAIDLTTGNRRYYITAYVIWANQKTAFFVYRWQRATVVRMQCLM